MQLDEGHTKIEEVKLIDFGSTFKFDSEMNVSATTPEYLSPEMLTYLHQISKKMDNQQEMATKLHGICKNWSFDVWSLGIIIIEILTGYPVWL